MNYRHQHPYAQDLSEPGSQPQVDGTLVLLCYASRRTDHLVNFQISNDGVLSRDFGVMVTPSRLSPDHKGRSKGPITSRAWPGKSLKPHLLGGQADAPLTMEAGHETSGVVGTLPSC